MTPKNMITIADILRDEFNTAIENLDDGWGDATPSDLFMWEALSVFRQSCLIYSRGGQTTNVSINIEYMLELYKGLTSKKATG